MPVKAAKRGDKWIVVEAATGKKTPSSGSFDSQAKAKRQAAAINASLQETRRRMTRQSKKKR